MNGPGPIFLLFAGLAAFVAFDAFRVWDLRRLVVSLVATVVLAGCGAYGLRALHGQERPLFANRLQNGFGPEWDCSSGAICVKKPLPH